MVTHTQLNYQPSEQITKLPNTKEKCLESGLPSIHLFFGGEGELDFVLSKVNITIST